MKVQKRINYYHNRHRSDGALIESQRIRSENEDDLLILSDQEENKVSNSNYKNKNYCYNNSMNIKNENNINLNTEENIRNNSNKYINDNKINFIYKDENYLNDEYNQSSQTFTKKLSTFIKHLSKPLPKLTKKKEILDNQIEEENLLLTKENFQLEEEINLLQKNINFFKNINSDDNIINKEEPTQNEIQKLYNMNQKLMKDNQNYIQAINKMRQNKENEKSIDNSLKYKVEFLSQNIVSSMKELIYLLEKDPNNPNLTLDNKSYSFMRTDNFDNFTQSSFSQENQSKDQFSIFHSELNNNINYYIYNDNSRNYKDREINFSQK